MCQGEFLMITMLGIEAMAIMQALVGVALMRIRRP